MNTNYVNYIKCLIVCILVVIFTIWAGSASINISLYLNSLGVNLPLREPLNLFIAFICFKFLKKNFPVNHIDINLGNLKSYILGASVIVIWLFLAWLIAYLSKALVIKPIPNPLYFSLLLGFVLVFIHGAAEELMLQSVIRPVIQNYFGKDIAIIITALSFMTIQYFQGYDDIFELLNSFIFGMVTALLAMRFGLFAAIAMHSLWTFIETILISNFYKIEFINTLYSNGGNDTYKFIGFALIGMIIFPILSKLTANKNL